MRNSTVQITFGTDFHGMFALLLDLHDSFGESGAKTTQTVHANKLRYQQSQIILVNCLQTLRYKKEAADRIFFCEGSVHPVHIYFLFFSQKFWGNDLF